MIYPSQIGCPVTFKFTEFSNISFTFRQDRDSGYVEIFEVELERQSFGKCLDCGKERSSVGWCGDCEINALKKNFKNWTSGDPNIDDFIKRTQLNATGSVDYLEYIDFEQFELVENTNEGDAFGKIYLATWLEGPRSVWDENAEKLKRCGHIKVILKKLNKSQNFSKEYLKQLYEYHRCLQSGGVADCLGFTIDSTSNYMFVMRYEKGRLYTYLDEAQETLSLSNIIDMLWGVAKGIKNIHESGLIHGNIHGDNLSRLTSTQMDLYGPVDQKNANEIYGVLPYIAPEVLKGSPPTKASDIYSFGIIMWTLSAGVRPWCNRPHDLRLANEIYLGLRPKIIDGIPNGYIQLMTQCWDSEPSRRPTASELYDILESWCDEVDQFGIEIFSDSEYEFEQQEIHPQAFYTSRLLDFS